MLHELRITVILRLRVHTILPSLFLSTEYVKLTSEKSLPINVRKLAKKLSHD